MKKERRNSPRTRLQKVTYIRLPGNNGAIILNVSEQGFCFHSVGPILETGPIRFSYTLQGNQLEASGDLAWIDGTRKTGGVRLTEVSAVVKGPSSIWRSRLRNAEFQSLCLQKALPELPISLGSMIAPEPEVRAESLAQGADLAPAPLAALPKVTVRTQTDNPNRRNHSQPIRTKLLTTDARINAGVIALGFIIFIAFAALLTHAYASRLHNSIPGQQDSLLGVLESAQSSPRALLSQPSLQGTPEAFQASGSLQELRGNIEALEKEYDDESELAPSGLAARGNKTQPPGQIDSSHEETFKISPSAEIDAAVPPTPPVPANTDDGKSVLGADSSPKTNPDLDISSAASYALVDPETATYFDVGNFKELLWADKATGDLVKLGFHAIVIHKSLLWMQSFHVLVGPFGGDRDSEAARAKLETLGFSPRMAKTH